MDRMQSNGWKLATHAKSHSPLPMAEPRHRIGPEGTTSGVSLRPNDVPQSSVKRVKEICLHYVRKCSGKYVDNKAAARYVHQMADEVIGQLAGIIAQIHRYEAEPELYQALLDDWEENFPLSLGALGTPKAVANSLAKQAEEIRKLTNDLEAEKQKHESDVSNVLRSMDAQLLAYRSGIVGERRQIAIAHDLQLQEHDRKLSYVQAEAEQAKLALEEQHKVEIQAIRKHYDKKIKQLESSIRDVESSGVQSRLQQEKEFERVLRGRDDIIKSAQKQIKSLQEENLRKSGILAGIEGDDQQSLVSLDIGIVESESESEDEDSLSSIESSSESDDDTPEQKKVISAMPSPAKEKREKEKRDEKQRKQDAREARRKDREQRKAVKQAAKDARKAMQQKRMVMSPRSVASDKEAVENPFVSTVPMRSSDSSLLTSGVQPTRVSKQVKEITPRVGNVSKVSPSRTSNQPKQTVTSTSAKKPRVKKEKVKSIKISGVIADGVRKLKEEIQTLRLLRTQSDKAVVEMQSECDHYKHEHSILFGRIRDLDQINEGLRSALKQCLEQLEAVKAGQKQSVPARSTIRSTR